MRTPSLGRRNIAANGLIALVVIASAGSAAYLLLRSMLHGALDEALANRAAIAESLAQDRPPEALVDELAALGIRASLATPAGEVLVAEPDALRVSRTAVPASEHARVRSLSQPLPDGSLLTLEGSTAGIDETLARFRLAAGAIALAAVGATAILSAAGTRVTHAPLRSLAAVARSVTRGELDSRAAPDDPSSELGQVAHAFDEMLDELQAKTRALADAEAASRQLVDDVAHQLRTPLTGILLLTEQLESLEDEPQRRRCAGEVRAAAARAAGLGDRLLRLATHGRAPQEAAACDATAVAHTLVRDARERRADRRVSVDAPESPVPVALARDELEDALGNLIDNALRHAGRDVDVRLSTSGSAVEITVTDDGPGVPPEQIGRIFERFFTLDEQEGGTGIGLPIARAAARRRGGDLTYEGGRFVLRLPLAESEP